MRQLALASLVLLATPLPLASQPDASINVVRASGALAHCLGIWPGSARMQRGPEAEQYCRQLPAADMYDQAGARFKAGDHAAAARIVARAAQAGNALAQLRLAIMHENGDGVPRDSKAALLWYSRAAALGEPAAQMELGGYYEEADGVPENWDLAAKLYQASAVQGWMKGQFALGRAYEFGIGVPQNRLQAIAWFEKSAAQGNTQGAYYARWLRDPTNNIGFRSDAEHDLVIAGKLRFALGAADPAGIAFHTSNERFAWLRGLGAQVNASEAQVMWQLGKDQYDACVRKGGSNCRSPGARPQR
ncbi:MAG: tetratricopeptide repeat protein [Gemmatimonadaceae bacterium]